MFTWECPKCGKELDVATDECPDCSGNGQPAKKAAPAVATEERPPSPPKAAAPPKRQPAASQPEMPLPARREAVASKSRRAKKPVALGLEPSHLGILALILVMAVALAVFFARPDIFSRGGLRLEEVPPAAQEPGSAGTASLGDLQVAGIRAFYGEDYKPRVRAVVINHSESPREDVNLEVQLRPAEANANDSALASFVIQLEEALGPHESREIEADLNALGTLASLPAWDRVRIDLQSRASGSPPAEN